jgi:hypothetical protein
VWQDLTTRFNDKDIQKIAWNAVDSFKLIKLEHYLAMPATPRLDFSALFIVAFYTTSIFPGFPSMAQMSAPDLNQKQAAHLQIFLNPQMKITHP